MEASSLLVKGFAAHEYPISQVMLSMPIWALPEELVRFSAARCALMWWLYFLGLPQVVQVVESGWWTGLVPHAASSRPPAPAGGEG